jgi:hypothetical protein
MENYVGVYIYFPRKIKVLEHPYRSGEDCSGSLQRSLTQQEETELQNFGSLCPYASSNLKVYYGVPLDPIQSQMKPVNICKIWGFQGGDYEERRLLGCGAV